MAEMIATPANMKRLTEGPLRVQGATLIAYSPRTFEQYSATPGDYFFLPDDTPLLDGMDQPMVLAYTHEKVTIVDDDPDTPASYVRGARDAIRAENFADALTHLDSALEALGEPSDG